MLKNEDLVAIVQNYYQQSEIYKQMEELSALQLQKIKEDKQFLLSGELDKLLNQRKDIIIQLDKFAEVNKFLQVKAAKKLGIKEFSLANIEKLISPEDYQALKAVLNEIETILVKISISDKENAELLRKFSHLKKSQKRTSNKEASQAYKDAMTKSQHNSNNDQKKS